MVLLSAYVLFTPRTGGGGLFPGADKVVHAALFGLLAATTRWRFGPVAVGFVAVAAYAVASEVAQAVLLTSRSGDAYDVVADLLGAVVGWLVAGRLLSRVAD